MLALGTWTRPSVKEGNGWRVKYVVEGESGPETPQSIVLHSNAGTVCQAAMCSFVLQERPFCSQLRSARSVFPHN